MKKHIENYLTTKRNLKIFYRCWWSEVEPKAAVFIIHGLGEHSGRYERLVEALSPRGFQFIAIDLPGFGKSGGKRGHIERFEHYYEDIEHALKNIHYPGIEGIPMFLLGHSMGGLIGFHVALQYKKYFKGVILSAPVFQLTMEVPGLKTFIGKVFSKLFPALTQPNGLDPAWLSHDTQIVEKYKQDPLVHNKISFRLFTEMLQAMKDAQELAPNFPLPLLLIQGSDDLIVHPDGAGKIFEKIRLQDKKLLIYDGFYHESFNERDSAVVFDDLERWILQHL